MYFEEYENGQMLLPIRSLASKTTKLLIPKRRSRSAAERPAAPAPNIMTANFFSIFIFVLGGKMLDFDYQM
jgi:hypothetical protein